MSKAMFSSFISIVKASLRKELSGITIGVKGLEMLAHFTYFQVSS